MVSSVALLVSAWIEIGTFVSIADVMSAVALLVSAWIEIGLEQAGHKCIGVALLVSAWIEMR